MRPVLIKTIQNISKKCKMSNVCVHLAVCLLDYFMDNHDLKFDTIILVSFACLTLAGKYNFYHSCTNNIIFLKIYFYFNSKN